MAASGAGARGERGVDAIEEGFGEGIAPGARLVTTWQGPGTGNTDLPEDRIAASDAIDAPVEHRVGQTHHRGSQGESQNSSLQRNIRWVFAEGAVCSV
jgi:hypothetical protein